MLCERESNQDTDGLGFVRKPMVEMSMISHYGFQVLAIHFFNGLQGTLAAHIGHILLLLFGSGCAHMPRGSDTCLCAVSRTHGQACCSFGLPDEK